MKKWLALIILVPAFFCGCDEQKGLNSVLADYPLGDVRTIPMHKYEYLVREKDGSIVWVFSDGGFSTTRTTIIFKADK